MSTFIESLHEPAVIDYADNEAGAIEKLQELNEFYRRNRWPAEFANTSHKLANRDSRNVSFLPNESVHLVVTSPPVLDAEGIRAQRASVGRNRGLRSLSRRTR